MILVITSGFTRIAYFFFGHSFFSQSMSHMLDLSVFKVKGKSFVYKLNQFNGPSYTPVCSVCKTPVENKCKIHPRDKYVVCNHCGVLSCWKTYCKNHPAGCTITDEPYYREVLSIRKGKDKQRKSTRIEQIPENHIKKVPHTPTKRLNIGLDRSPAKRTKLNRDYLNPQMFQNVINNRSSQVLPNVGSIKHFSDLNVIVYCRYCFLVMHTPRELCKDHSDKKYYEVNKYICTDCGHIMAYSSYKRHFINNSCKLLLNRRLDTQSQVISNYPNIHSSVHPFIHLIVPLGDDFLLLLNDLCSSYSPHVIRFCDVIQPMLHRFLSILRINTDLNSSNPQVYLDQLNSTENDSIFEPVSPVSNSATSSVSCSSVDCDNALYTSLKINNLFNASLSIIDECSSLRSFMEPNFIVNDEPISTVYLITDRLTFIIEELMIMSCEFYKVYTEFHRMIDSILNDEFGNITDIRQRITDITLILDNKQSNCYTRVFTTEFSVVENEDMLFDDLKQKRIELQNQLVESEIFKEKSSEYLKLVDLAVGTKISMANRKMNLLTRELKRINELDLFEQDI
eukprot:NODE_33_length_32023_cov_0.217579.p3 type:complete len:566 gc:universal NODE_33_length_32023_cov_0.217579:19223-17526(-)